MTTRRSLRELWVEGEGRLGGLPRPAAVMARAAKIDGLVDKPSTPARVCFRCGANGWKGAPLSGCTEKRGQGVPWKHEYGSPVRDDPFRIPMDATTDGEWRRMTVTELIDFARYLATKAQGSLAATIAWTAVRDAGNVDPATDYAIALYREKAEKRTRLMAWVLNVIDRRLAAGEVTKEA